MDLKQNYMYEIIYEFKDGKFNEFYLIDCAFFKVKKTKEEYLNLNFENDNSPKNKKYYETNSKLLNLKRINPSRTSRTLNKTEEEEYYYYNYFSQKLKDIVIETGCFLRT